MFYEARS